MNESCAHVKETRAHDDGIQIRERSCQVLGLGPKVYFNLCSLRIVRVLQEFSEDGEFARVASQDFVN